jgi:hypothetical protein
MKIYIIFLAAVGILADLLAIRGLATHYVKRQTWILFSLVIAVTAFGIAVWLYSREQRQNELDREALQATANTNLAYWESTSTELKETRIKLESAQADHQHMIKGIEELAAHVTNCLTMKDVRAYLMAPQEQRPGVLALLTNAPQPEAKPGTPQTQPARPGLDTQQGTSGGHSASQPLPTRGIRPPMAVAPLPNGPNPLPPPTNTPGPTAPKSPSQTNTPPGTSPVTNVLKPASDLHQIK